MRHFVGIAGEVSFLRAVAIARASLRKWIKAFQADSKRSKAIAKHQAITMPEPEPEADSVKMKRALAQFGQAIVEIGLKLTPDAGMPNF